MNLNEGRVYTMGNINYNTHYYEINQIMISSFKINPLIESSETIEQIMKSIN